MLDCLLSYLFPVECVECYRLGSYLCTRCRKSLRSHPDVCPYCHRPQEFGQRCLDCALNKRKLLHGIIIGFNYDELVKKLILQLKYYHKSEIAHFFAEQLSWLVRSHPLMQNWSGHNTIISSVPNTRRRRLWVKGYNQSERLAQELSVELGRDYVALVEKVRSTKRQAALSREQRLVNLQGAFGWKKDTVLDPGIEHIVLVDDVTTTASTLNEVALAIKQRYPQVAVWAVVIARHG